MQDMLKQFFSHPFTLIQDALSKRLWIRPLLVSIFSVLVVSVAYGFGHVLENAVFSITLSSLKQLLSVMAGSLLAVSTFAVTSMVSAYASASTTATPRSFDLVIADDSSKNALSSFIGVFIFSVVSLIALENEVFSDGGRFIIFVFSLLGFALVIWMFIRWVDDIARLGRLGNTIKLVYEETEQHLTTAQVTPLPELFQTDGLSAYAITLNHMGYVQNVNHEALQTFCKKHDCYIRIHAHVGDYIYPTTAVLTVLSDSSFDHANQQSKLQNMVVLGQHKLFAGNPLFGVEVLSEIAARALSPAVNDNGTAIEVIHAQTQLLFQRDKLLAQDETQAITPFDRLSQPAKGIEVYLHMAFHDIMVYGSDNLGVMRALVVSLCQLLAQTPDKQTQLAIDAMLADIKIITQQNMTLASDKKALLECLTNAYGLHATTVSCNNSLMQ